MKPVTGTPLRLVYLLAAALVVTGPLSPRAVRAGRRVDAAAVPGGTWSSGTKHACCGPHQSCVSRIPDGAWQSHVSLRGLEALELTDSPSVLSAAASAAWLGALRPVVVPSFPTLRELEVRIDT